MCVLVLLNFHFLALRATNCIMQYSMCVRTHTHIHTHNTHTHTHSPPTNIHHAPPSPLHTHFPHHAFPWACVKAGLPDHPDHQKCRAKKNSQFIKYACWHCNKHLHVRLATCTAKNDCFNLYSRLQVSTTHVQGSTNTFWMTANTPV